MPEHPSSCCQRCYLQDQCHCRHYWQQVIVLAVPSEPLAPLLALVRGLVPGLAHRRQQG
jgi:hypothetical protein